MAYFRRALRAMTSAWLSMTTRPSVVRLVLTMQPSPVPTATTSPSSSWPGPSTTRLSFTHTQTDTPFVRDYPGEPVPERWKISPDFTQARDNEWQWHQLNHMQVCTSFQTENLASTPSLSFYRPDALPAAQPTASKHWMQNVYHKIF